MTRVTLSDLSVMIGRRMALSSVSFDVPAGAYAVVVGPSGCGKTTVLRAIAGLTRPVRGQVAFDGIPVNGLPPGERNVAMCFQSYALYPRMTVLENWTFPLRAARLPEHEIRSRVEAIAELLHMQPLLHRYPRELSGGQQQRVALGRALVRTPRLYLLDEPFGSLDAKLRVELRTAIKKLQMERGITTIHVTHDQIEAQALGDILVVLREGVVQQVGPPEEVYEKPANLFVARFIGSPPMNFLECTLMQENGSWWLQHPWFRIPIPAAKAVPVARSGRVDGLIVGVRPENIRLAPHGEAGIPIEIYLVEPQGNEFIVDLKVNDLVLKARVRRDRMVFEPKANEKVSVTFDADALHLFDKVGGRRLG